MSSFSSIHIALQAILTHQSALDVVGHNVANASTPGYHRQSAVLQAGPASGVSSLAASTVQNLAGNGVVMTEVRRFSMEFIDSRYRSELAETSRYDVEQSFLAQIEASMAETSKAGLNTKLDEFWSAWKEGSTNPEDITRRSDLLETSKNLASAISSRAQELYQFRVDQNVAIVQRVDEINDITGQIAKLNAEIGRFVAPGSQANDYKDQIDLLVDRLSEIAGAKTTYEANGQAMISIGGHVLVQGTSAYQLETTPQPTNFNMVDVYWEDGQALMTSDGNSTLQSGELAGYQQLRDVITVDQVEQLNNMATQITSAVNAIHQNGYGLNESVVYDPTDPPTGAGRNFFVIGDPAQAAMSMKVNSALEDVSLIGFSKIDVPTGTTAGTTLTAASGDGSIAESIYNLQDSSQTFPDGTIDTINHYNTMRVSDFALTIKNVETMKTQHTNLEKVLNEQRESVNGVSLDEEAANMLQYQRSYQAAVRVMTAADDMIDRAKVAH